MYNYTIASVPKGYAAIGGLPSGPADSHIAIAFIVLFTLLRPIWLLQSFRHFRISFGTTQIGVVFFTVANGLRLASAHSGSFNESRLVAEQTMWLLGTYFICASVSDLLEINLGSALTFGFLDPDTYLLIASLILGCVSSSVLLRTKPADILGRSIIRCRKASAIIFFVVSVFYVTAAVLGARYSPFELGWGRVRIVIMTLLLVVVSLYQLSLWGRENPPIILTVQQKTEWAVLWQLPMLLISALLIWMNPCQCKAVESKSPA